MDKYSLAFSVSNLGPKSFQKLINNFGSSKVAWAATKLELEKLGISGLTYEKFEKFRKGFDFSRYIKRLEKENVIFVSFDDKEYPKKFKKLENPPIGIFCKGNVSLLKNGLKIAVVGTRKITSYGRNVTEVIVAELADSNICVVSGLALGVDGLSHKVALERKGSAIAVMPCGVDCCLPSENFSIYSSILKSNGLIISEYPLSQPPNKGTFLARNRLIASLSDGVLVTEAAENSGSLVTAQWGFRLSKKVFAVPGSINSSMAKGSLKLLKQGAKLVTEGNDILDEFEKNKKLRIKNNSEEYKNMSKDEMLIIVLLENESLTIDEMLHKTNINIARLFAILAKLEILKIVKNSSGVFSRS